MRFLIHFKFTLELNLLTQLFLAITKLGMSKEKILADTMQT